MWVVERIKNEPVAVMAVVAAAIYLVSEFGFNVTGGQQGAIIGFTQALLWFITRRQVSPGNKLKDVAVQTSSGDTLIIDASNPDKAVIK